MFEVWWVIQSSFFYGFIVEFAGETIFTRNMGQCPT